MTAYAAAAQAPNTTKAYESDWRQFERWATHTGAASSPLSAQSIALIIKRRASAAGLDSRDFAGHSLRSGFSTQAARDGYLPAQIADITRHKDRRTLDGYIQAGRGAEHIARVL